MATHRAFRIQHSCVGFTLCVFSQYSLMFLALSLLLSPLQVAHGEFAHWLELSGNDHGNSLTRNHANSKSRTDLELDGFAVSSSPLPDGINGLVRSDSAASSSDEEYLTDSRQETFNPVDMGGVSVLQAAQDLSTRLRWLSNDEIGITNMQAVYDSLPYEEKSQSEEEHLESIVERLRLRFRKYLQVLRTNKITVENLYKFHVKQPITLGLSCCSMPCSDFKSHSLYGCQIARHTSCDLIPPSIPRGAFNPGRNLTEVWRSNVQYFPSLKWQYFISVEGLHSEYPASSFNPLCQDGGVLSSRAKDCLNAHDTRHRDVFLHTIQPQRKYVVIVMDHGNSMSLTQLRTAKAITKHLIASFSDNDRIGLIGLSSQPSYVRKDECLQTMVPATFETRHYLSKFVDHLDKVDSTTNHTLGFLKAFKMIEDLMAANSISENAMILYVSRGLLSSLTEAKEVMDVVAVHNANTGNKVIINTYAVIDDGKAIMYEKSFLKDVAYQNFARYEVQYRLKTPVIRGIMMAINSTQDLSSSVGRFYLPLNRTTGDDPVFSLPYIDEADGALTMSLSQPCVHTLPDQPQLHHLIGLVGLDLHVEDVAQDVTYYQPTGSSSFAFIITTQGYTIMHPSLQRPLKTNIQPMHTDIEHFEQHAGFLQIRAAILSQAKGDTTLVLSVVNQTTHDGQWVQVEQEARYLWQKVESVPFIVVIKSIIERREQKQLKNIPTHNQPELLYHRLDLFPNERMCYHLKQLVTPELTTIFLAASSFINPFEHLSEEETKRTVGSYIAYLKDETRLITNPGLKAEVRSDVMATGRISEEWLRRYKASDLNAYIVRRYVGTPSGVLRTFPGTLLNKMYDPTKREWYTKAIEFPGHVTLSAPYLDVGGAGYIVTISHTIYEGKPAALHSPRDQVVAVMGMDITLGYFHRLLATSIKACGEGRGIRCFLMDDRGYLIAHPGLIDPTGKGPAERRHITHMEPLVANDILNHRGFVQKKLCNRYNDRTVQRYFTFNTSFSGVLANLVHGEQCARYQITHIAGTNAFLGLVNQTCDTATAFCPCSMFDRMCLNCKRMEQTECECPCECQLQMNFCTGQLLDSGDKNPSCPHDPEREELAETAPTIKLELEQCFLTQCEKRTNQMDCMGVMDCQWCQVHQDGKTPLESPYCASQRVCFGGVVGAHSPYGDEISVEVETSDHVGVKSTPVGPVAGGIMGCFLLLALGVYCYRHHVHRHSPHYMSTLPDNTNRISHYYHDEEQEAVEDVSTGECHTNFVLASFENPASMSPYRVNTSYRRPAGGDSDHGYSTMTPHEDSEHASMPCLDPLSIGKDRFRPAGYPVSLCKPPVLPPPPQSSSRRSRSPTPPQTWLSTPIYSSIPEQTILSLGGGHCSDMLGQTVIPTPLKEPHNILASVQVHVVDTK